MNNDYIIVARIYATVRNHSRLFEKFRGLSEGEVINCLSNCPPLELLQMYDDIVKYKHYDPGPNVYLDTGRARP